MDLSNKQNRSTLKSYFERGDIPTEQNFSELIDGMLSHADDKIAKVANNPVSVEAEGDGPSLQKVIEFYRDFSQASADWSIMLNPRSNPAQANTANLGLGIGMANGVSRLFIEESSGNVGIRTNTPGNPLAVVGNGATLGLYSSQNGGHTYVALFADGENQPRSGWIGYATNNNPRLYINNSKTNGHIILQPQGNVGIGNTNPTAATLQVSGDIRTDWSHTNDQRANLYIRNINGALNFTPGNGTHGSWAGVSSDGNESKYGYNAVVGGNGGGGYYGLFANVNGTGNGSKFGVRCAVSGEGPIYGGYFDGINSAGSNLVMGLYGAGTGNGTGTKFGVRAYTSGNGPKYTGYFDSNNTSNNTAYGLYSYVYGSGTGAKFGLYARTNDEASANTATYALYGYNTGSGTGTKYGIYAYVNSTANTTKYGVYGRASGNSGTKYGVRGYASGDGTRYAIFGSTGGGSGTRYAGYFSGNVHVTGTLTKASGSFLIDHPDDPANKTLRHNFVESPEFMCLYRGKIEIGTTKKKKVQLPAYFAGLNDATKGTVILTPLGKDPALGLSYEWAKDGKSFTVYASKGKVEVSYLVMAERNDPAVKLERRPVEEEKGANYFEKGKYLNPEAYGKGPELGVHHDPEQDDLEEEEDDDMQHARGITARTLPESAPQVIIEENKEDS